MGNSAGATAVRREAVQTLLAGGQFAVIKGNEGEIQTLHNSATSAQQRGVDSASTLDISQRAALTSSLARRTSAVVLMTGKTDVLSDGKRTFRVDNGHELLGMITGTGCTLGTVVSAAASAYPGDKLMAAVASTATFGVAAQRAAERSEVRGPGTFVPAFLDELYAIRTTTAKGNTEWLSLVNVQAVEIQEDSL